MTILVDAALWRWRGRRWAHLASDDSYEELHAFAARLGLQRAWFQGDHYDVPSDVRAQALRLGATPVSSRELLLRLSDAGLRQPRGLRRVNGLAAPGNPWLHDPTVGRGEAYQRILEQRAAATTNPHGEADLVSRLLADHPEARVLDAGCGTGRVGIELARRGFAVVGVDLDPDNLAVARRLHPGLTWLEADLARLDLPALGVPGRFDLAVAAGNVLCFLTPGTHAAAVAGIARHLAPGGLLVAGFQLRRGFISAARYDRLCAAAGLRLLRRDGGWHGEPPGPTYQVSVHQRREGP